MLALCLMLSGTYYAKNYAGIIGRGLLVIQVYKMMMLMMMTMKMMATLIMTVMRLVRAAVIQVIRWQLSRKYA